MSHPPTAAIGAAPAAGLAAPPPAAPLLDAQGIGITFGGLKAVQNLTIQLPARGLHGLIGPNGAGKTTAFNLLTGVYRTQTGRVTIAGQRVDGLPPHLIAKAGLSRTFQNIRLFGELSVLDNVRLACHMRAEHTLADTLLRTPRYFEHERAMKARALDLLQIFNLGDLATEQAKNLPYGAQRRLEIIRALATGPKVLLLDEPAAGLNPQETAALADSIRGIRDRFGVAILLIEHDMSLVMKICENITVLDYGVTIAVGPPEKVQNDPRVIEAYLGVPEGSTHGGAA